MVYPNLKFPKNSIRPYFYTNFVSTADGKVWVLKNSKDYWPIGSRKDYQVLIELRAYADVLIHGKNLANEFGKITVRSLQDRAFKALRRKLGKNPGLPYYIIRSRSQSLPDLSRDFYQKGYKCILVEGGPTVLASFLKENLLDEIFLTISPKIIGNKPNSTLTLVEGYLFPKDSIINLNLLSIKRVKSEIFLRYRVIR